MGQERRNQRGVARRALQRAAAPMLARRHLLPEPLDGALDRLRWIGRAPRDVRHPVSAPGRGRGHLLIAPANFAGQGRQWARAYERETGRAANCWMFSANDVFAYPADFIAPIGIYKASRAWQRRQFALVAESFDAVVIEAGRPLFGSLFGFDPVREAEALAETGIRVALLWHGTDIRLPSDHAATHRLSPYAPVDDHSARQESVVRRNRRRLGRFAGPALVSTPDLLLGVEGSQWCPVVVDTHAWAGVTPVLERERPLVVHVPSNAHIKGTELIRPALRRLEAGGVIEYREAAGLPWAQVRDLYRTADIVLDQFRLGIYGVAACEAMAAGRVVLSSVDGAVREKVRGVTGLDLPIIETPAQSVAERIHEVLGSRDQFRRQATAGVDFVSNVHDGRRSAEVLAELVGRDPGGVAHG